MRKATKIAWVLAILILGIICVRIVPYQSLSEDDVYDAGIIDEVDNLSTTTTSKFETKEDIITGIRLHIDGSIRGAGMVKLGASDTVSFREYPVSTGKVDIGYEGDWYSKVCYVTFVPTQPTTGKITIDFKFVGD